MRSRGGRPAGRRMVALAGALVLGGVASGCGSEEPKPAPVVVEAVKASPSGSIRICPKCYRRFFGGQTTCTVDGTSLIDYVPPPDAAATPAPAAMQLAQATPQGDAPVAPAAEDDPARRVAGLPREPARDDPAVQPVKVVSPTGAVPRYEPPPMVEPGAPRQPAPAQPQAARPAEATPPPKAAPEAPTRKDEPQAVAAVPQKKPGRSAEEVLADLLKDVNATAEVAQTGKLSADEVGALTSVGMGDEERFTASRSLLAMHYRATGNTSEYGKTIDDLMKIPSNQYNPSIRLEQAELYLLTKRYQDAIDAASVAERYSSKFPKGDAYYVRVARTYEVLAKSYEGRFSTSEDPDDLDLAIRMWQRYLTHVEKKEDTKRIKLAKDNIAKLERIKERVL